jgi:hypothetical protein
VIPDDDFDGGLEGSPFEIFEKEFPDLDDPSLYMCAEGAVRSSSSFSGLSFALIAMLHPPSLHASHILLLPSLQYYCWEDFPVAC